MVTLPKRHSDQPIHPSISQPNYFRRKRQARKRPNCPTYTNDSSRSLSFEPHNPRSGDVATTAKTLSMTHMFPPHCGSFEGDGAHGGRAGVDSGIKAAAEAVVSGTGQGNGKEDELRWWLEIVGSSEVRHIKNRSSAKYLTIRKLALAVFVYLALQTSTERCCK